MSLFESASLVVTPNGIKASKLYAIKPTDGSGDLSVVRATSATRVDANGLIEIPRTNVLTYSEEFATSWINNGATIISNDTTDPDGNLTADRLTATGGAFGVVKFSTWSATNRVASCFVKANTSNLFRIANVSGGGGSVTFNLSTQAITATTGFTGSIEALPNGWFRCVAIDTLARSGTFSIGVTAIGESVFVWGAQLEIGNSATEYIPTTSSIRTKFAGIIQNGSSALNIPRLDYSNGSCPSILVEPQRTNLLLRSEEFENSYFSKLASSISVNSTTSPNNTITADKLVEDTSASAHRFISTSFATTSGTSYSVSIFLKRAEREYAYIRLNNSGGDIIAANINLLNGTVSQLIFGTITIIPYDNDWYRVIATGTSISTSNGSFEVRISNSPTYANYTGNGTSGIYIWGAQLEAGENATSYIPTTTASVTRNADVISKTGISSLIGQTEGTVLCDINLTKLSEGKGLFAIDNGTTNEYIALIRISTNIFRLRLKNSSGSAVTLINSIVINDARCKVGIAYKNGDYAMYVNGVLRGTSTNSTNYPTTTLTQFILSNASYGQLNDSYNVSALWKTRLSNSELATLTTI